MPVHLELLKQQRLGAVSKYGGTIMPNEYCDKSSDKYNLGLCKLSQFVMQLYQPPKTIPTIPPRDEMGGLKLSADEMSSIQNQVIFELMTESIRKGDLSESSTILTTMKKTGLFQKVIASKANQYQEAVEHANLISKELISKELTRK